MLFLVPFVWLVVTSLKEESEMSKFPPVWIPTQQVTLTLDGKERGLATARYQGALVKVAVMQEFETGERRVRIHAIGFPVRPDAPQYTSIRFATLMRILCQRNGGTFVGLEEPERSRPRFTIGDAVLPKPGYPDPKHPRRS